MKKEFVKKMIIAVRLVSLLCGLAACAGEQESAGAGQEEELGVRESAVRQDDSILDVTDAGADSIFSEDSDVMNITVAMPSGTSLHTEPNQWYDRVVAEINEYTGMDVTWKWYATKEYEEQIKKDIQSGEVADVILVTERSEQYEEMIKSGLLWEVGGFIDDYENHAMTYEVSRLTASYNGRMYGLPRRAEPLQWGLGYRVDWLKKLGLETPADWESFEKMLYAFTYNDPDGNGEDDTVGLVLDSHSETWDVMETWFGVPNVWGIDENGDLIHKTRTQEYRNAYAAFRELYAQGLINNGSHGIADFREYVYWGTEKDIIPRAGSSVGLLLDFTNVNNRLVKQGAVAEGETVFDLRACVDTGLGELCYSSDGVRSIVAVTTARIKSEEQLKRVLQFLNDLNSATCDNLLRYGWEGISYFVDEKDKNMKLSHWSYPKEAEESGITSYGGGLTEILTGFVTAENKNPLYSQYSASTPLIMLKNRLEEEYRDKCVMNYGYPFITETEKAKGEELEAQLFEAEIQYITGEIDENGFEAALAAWWENGGEAMTEEINVLYHAAGY